MLPNFVDDSLEFLEWYFHYLLISKLKCFYETESIISKRGWGWGWGWGWG